MNPVAILRILPWGLCAILFGLWQWDRAELANDKAKAEAAVIAAQERADKLSDELIIQQAIAMGVTEKKVVTYVDRIQASPDDSERNRLGSRGVRDIIQGSSPPSVGKPAPAVPRP